MKHRAGLIALLKDVISGTAGFKAILVYDVSRGGRFQDCDEAAHCEFLRKGAGIPVHYRAESIGRRSELAEYLDQSNQANSREMGSKVFVGCKHLPWFGIQASFVIWALSSKTYEEHYLSGSLYILIIAIRLGYLLVMLATHALDEAEGEKSRLALLARNRWYWVPSGYVLLLLAIWAATSAPGGGVGQLMYRNF